MGSERKPKHRVRDWVIGGLLMTGLILGAGWLEANVNANTFGWILVGVMFLILILILATNAYLRRYKEEDHDHR